MDLSFARSDRDLAAAMLPTGLAVLMAMVTSRQAASPTARIQTRLSMPLPVAALLAPADGCFHRAAATALHRWGEA
ncbi:hypothetical protein [Sphingomonas sp. TDK1]|uniref:hypothetical protein n=1 Tax=Sphingomonas sp. TDK1 TaxID=453247 RepID=UPI0007D9B950|nr:hypothetical protein [Sphingomonas sp. TDK1]OAN66260.1 hypothetical protein A7X12_12780 [Sphingomonas sp. TDK1]